MVYSILHTAWIVHEKTRYFINVYNRQLNTGKIMALGRTQNDTALGLRHGSHERYRLGLSFRAPKGRGTIDRKNGISHYETMSYAKSVF